jgi:hypothetical protein
MKIWPQGPMLYNFLRPQFKNVCIKLECLSLAAFPACWQGEESILKWELILGAPLG